MEAIRVDKRLVVVLAVLVLWSMGAVGQSIYSADVPMPTGYLSVGISDQELLNPLKRAFPRASFEDRGLRLYLPDSFSLVSIDDFNRLASWYWQNTSFQAPEDSIIGLIGLASSLTPWSNIPIGFAVRESQYPSPFIYVVFVTREDGRLIAYRLYYENGVICEPILESDCLVRLVVVF